MPLKWYGDEVEDKVRAGLVKGLTAGIEIVRTEAVNLIETSPASGRIYSRRGVQHQASAPGEPPAVDTGRLVGSLDTEVDADGLTATLTARDEKAPWLEFGTQNMEPRPFLRPALANTRDDVLQALSDAVKTELAG